MTALEILLAARKLIEDPDHWIKGRYTEKRVDPSGNGGYVDCYCTMGAIIWAAPGSGNREVRQEAKMLLLKALTGRDFGEEYEIVRWQDFEKRTHGEVMMLFDKAIELAQAKGVQDDRA